MGSHFLFIVTASILCRACRGLKTSAPYLRQQDFQILARNNSQFKSRCATSLWKGIASAGVCITNTRYLCAQRTDNQAILFRKGQFLSDTHARSTPITNANKRHLQGLDTQTRVTEQQAMAQRDQRGVKRALTSTECPF